MLRLILEQVSQLVFYPIIALLVALVGWTVIASGMFVRSAIARWRGSRPAMTAYMRLIDAAAARDEGHLDIRIEQVLNEAEYASVRDLNMVRFAVRAGPALGLMGTLIPMAAGLAGLAQGNLPALANHMVVAFSATIVGIGIGVCAHVIAMVREGWQRRDLDAIRLHAEQALRAHESTEYQEASS